MEFSQWTLLVIALSSTLALLFRELQATWRKDHLLEFRSRENEYLIELTRCREKREQDERMLANYRAHNAHKDGEIAALKQEVRDLLEQNRKIIGGPDVP